MATPTSSLATLRPDLASSFEEFDLAMNMRGFIAQRVMPVMNVASQAGTFGKIPIEELLKNKSVDRAPGGGYNRSNMKFTTASYATVERGSEEAIDDREAQMYADYIDAEIVAAMRAYNDVLMTQEQRVAALLFNATTYASYKTDITHEWDDATNATPIVNVEAAVRGVYDETGIWPDTLIMNRKVFRNLRNCDEIIDRLKYQGFQDVRAGNITEQALSQVFDLPKIIVAGSTKNTANEGQSASLSQVWSDEYAMVCKTATGNDMKEPCIGRTFHWSEDGSQPLGTVETYRDESVRSDIVRVRHDTDEQLLYVQMGHLLTNVTTI